MSESWGCRYGCTAGWGGWWDCGMAQGRLGVFWAEGEKPEEDEQVLPAGLVLLCRCAQNWALSPADSILTLTISPRAGGAGHAVRHPGARLQEQHCQHHEAMVRQSAQRLQSPRLCVVPLSLRGVTYLRLAHAAPVPSLHAHCFRLRAGSCEQRTPRQSPPPTRPAPSGKS